MLFSFITIVFNGLLRRCFGTQIIKVHYLGCRLSPKVSDIDKLVKPLVYNDFLIGDKEEFTPEKLEIIKKRFENKNYKAYGIIENNHLLYSSWISLATIGLPVSLKKPIFLDENQGYLEDDYCAINCRGRGIHTKMISYRLAKLNDLGKTVALTTVIDGNVPAIKANLKCGMNDLGVFFCGKILGKPFCSLTKKKKSSFDSRII